MVSTKTLLLKHYYRRQGNPRFFRFPRFFCFAVFLVFLCVFALFSKDFKASAGRKILAFFGGSSLFLPKKQGLEGQGCCDMISNLPPDQKLLRKSLSEN